MFHGVIQKIALAQFFWDMVYFRCILISRFWNVEISLHFNLAFSQYFTSIYLAFNGETEFLWVTIFNFVILSLSRNLWKFDAREKYVFYSNSSQRIF